MARFRRRAGWAGAARLRAALGSSPSAMAEALRSRLARYRFLGGVVCGAALGATASGLAAAQLLRRPSPGAPLRQEPPPGKEAPNCAGAVALPALPWGAGSKQGAGGRLRRACACLLGK